MLKWNHIVTLASLLSDLEQANPELPLTIADQKVRIQLVKRRAVCKAARPKKAERCCAEPVPRKGQEAAPPLSHLWVIPARQKQRMG